VQIVVLKENINYIYCIDDMCKLAIYLLFFGGCMQKRRIFSSAGIGTMVVAGALLFASCAPKITDEQKLQLKELRTQERNLTEQISKAKQEKSKLEAELNARKADLKRCDDEVSFIKSKLATWPDVWPDWKPEQK
jgi:hypothetical protein